MSDPVSLMSVAKTLKKPLDELYDLGKDRYKFKLQRLKANKLINNLYKRISSVQKVKTIWQVDKEVNLKKFYYPSKIIIDNDTKRINKISSLPLETNIIIQGTVGQGKSIFLRYLCSQELRIGKRIPLFIELRKLDPKISLKDLLIKALNSWGFDADDELFSFFSESGKFIFLLDGFDEVEISVVQKLITELEYFSEKYPDLRIIITSRPDSGIERSKYFRVYQLAPITRADHPGILNKLIENPHQSGLVLKSIDESSTEIKELLTTPLMMTLLVIIYKSHQKIPEQFSEFYENLFQTLLLRHDKSKPGYNRKRRCDFSEKELQHVFEAFCFLASKSNSTTMSFDAIHSLSNEAIKSAKSQCQSDEFIHDISKISCLVLEEGFDYHFVHKSVREFHAANFIRSRPEEFAIKFYCAMLDDKWMRWKQELKFLSQIDQYRYLKYFLIPYIKNTAKINNIKLTDEKFIQSNIDLKEILNTSYTEISLVNNSLYRINHGRSREHYLAIYSPTPIIINMMIEEISKKYSRTLTFSILETNQLAKLPEYLPQNNIIHDNLKNEGDNICILTFDLISFLGLQEMSVSIIENELNKLEKTYIDALQNGRSQIVSNTRLYSNHAFQTN